MRRARGIPNSSGKSVSQIVLFRFRNFPLTSQRGCRGLVFVFAPLQTLGVAPTNTTKHAQDVTEAARNPENLRKC